MSPIQADDWVEYRRLVLDKLEGLERDVKRIEGALQRIENDMATMKVKAGLLGALTSALTTLGVAVIWWISKR